MIIFHDFEKLIHLFQNELFQLEFYSSLVFVTIILWIVYKGLNYKKIRDIFSLHEHENPINFADFLKCGWNAPILSGNGISMMRIYFSLPLAFFTIIFYQDIVISSVFLHIYVLLFASDALDGAVARKLNNVSNFGKILDPLADKVLDLPILLIVCYFFENSYFLALAILICIVDIVGQSMRSKTSNPGANFIGKTKTVLKIIAIYVISLTRFGFYFEEFGIILLVLTLIFAIWSLITKLQTRV